MPNAKAIDWSKVLNENPGIDGQLDKLFERRGASECWNYIRQRQRKPELTARCRISFIYNGERLQTYIYRLIYARHHGGLPANRDVAHLCESNGNCGNPHHLICLPRAEHQKFDASQRAWIKAIKAVCPTATGHYGTTPKGWVTDRKSRKPRWPKPLKKG